MPSAASKKVLRKDGQVRKDARTAFTSTAPAKARKADADTKAKSERMVNEHIEGLGTLTTTTGLEVQTDLAGYVEQLGKLAGDVKSDLTSIHARCVKTGRVSTYAYRQLQEKMRVLNSAHQRLGLLVKDQLDPPKKAK
jgi:hypothetical protein